MSGKGSFVSWLQQVGIRSEGRWAGRVRCEGNQIWLRVGFWLCFQYVLLGLVNYANATGVHDWPAISKTKITGMRQSENIFIMNRSPYVKQVFSTISNRIRIVARHGALRCYGYSCGLVGVERQRDVASGRKVTRKDYFQWIREYSQPDVDSGLVRGCVTKIFKPNQQFNGMCKSKLGYHAGSRRDICFLGQITNERQQKSEESNQTIGNDLYPALSSKASRIIAIVVLCVFFYGIAISGSFDSVLVVIFSLFISVACGAVAFALWACSFH